MLALCVREAMTNIIKHSRAKRCTVKLETKDHAFGIHIADDGVGLRGTAAETAFRRSWSG